jgi:signal transduction histidine kinase
MVSSSERGGPQLVPQATSDDSAQTEQGSGAARARLGANPPKSKTRYGRRARDGVTMLAHELRNPLAAISSMLGLMRLRGMHSDEQAVIERQIDYMVRLINDLLDAGRLDGGKLVLRKRRIRLAEVVEAAVEMLAPLIEQRRQRLRISVPADLVVHVDASRMTQVLANLLDNAAKFSNVGARIIVRASRRPGGFVRLAVMDEGAGIDAQMLERVFELYTQQADTFGEGCGLGIGLAIVRGIVRLHDGDVHAQSGGPGKGSRFVIELPEHSRSMEAERLA